MVAQQTASPATTQSTPRLPAYRPTIEVIDEATGRYAVESETYKYLMYEVDIYLLSCTCPAGQNGRPCKHGQIAYGFAEARRQQRLAALRVQYPNPVAALLDAYPA
jgi:hypothetical protein